MKKVLLVCICLILLLAVVIGINNYKPAKTAAQQLSEWNRDGVIKELVAYVNDVTNPESRNFIPEADRIAVFDLDGTLVCEQFPIYFEWIMYAKRVLDDPTYEAPAELKELAVEILNSGISKNIADDMELRETICYDLAFAGMPVDEYKQYVKDFLAQEADSFDGLSYKDAYFRPMQQILNYLEDNGFVLYICSGTDRDADRVMAQGFFDFKNYQVVGSDSYVWIAKPEEKVNLSDEYAMVDYLEQQFTAGDVIRRDDEPIIKNVKAAKTAQIYREIGQQPVLAFGNSTGDMSMFAYTTANTKYKSAAFCLVPDDDTRDYAFPKKVEKLTKMCEENGWNVISMKNDFLTMYGDNVKKNPGKLTYTEYLLSKYNVAEAAA